MKYTNIILYVLHKQSYKHKLLSEDMDGNR